MLCSGKVTWDLLSERDKRRDGRTAVARLEQLYPLPVDGIRTELDRFRGVREVVWVQDEPANQGPWPYVALHLPEHLSGLPLRRVSRPESASPSVGSHSRHLAEQRALLDAAFG